MTTRNKASFYFETSKIVLGLMIALGFIYPLGSFWYIGCIIGAIIFGWGWKESMELMRTREEVPTHKIAALVVLIIIVANAVKFFFPDLFL